MPELCAFELQRAARIAHNQQKLAELVTEKLCTPEEPSPARGTKYRQLLSGEASVSGTQAVAKRGVPSARKEA